MYDKTKHKMQNNLFSIFSQRVAAENENDRFYKRWKRLNRDRGGDFMHEIQSQHVVGNTPLNKQQCCSLSV